MLDPVRVGFGFFVYWIVIAVIAYIILNLIPVTKKTSLLFRIIAAILLGILILTFLLKRVTHF
jgi:hypothetical protein